MILINLLPHREARRQERKRAFYSALGLAAMPLLARFAPAKYQSETLIMVVPQRVPESYVKATITQSIEDRLPSISEQILSRSRLERITGAAPAGRKAQ